MKDLRDDTKNLDEMEANTQLHASDIEEWKRKVESALAKTEEHLGEVDRKLRDEMADATDRFDVKKGNVQKSIRTQVATMKREVQIRFFFARACLNDSRKTANVRPYESED